MFEAQIGQIPGVPGNDKEPYTILTYIQFSTFQFGLHMLEIKK